MVLKVAKLYQHSRVELEDLLQEGYIGILIAIEKFNLRKNFRFWTYAYWWVKHRIIRAASSNLSVVSIPENFWQRRSLKIKKRKQSSNFLEAEREEAGESSTGKGQIFPFTLSLTQENLEYLNILTSQDFPETPLEKEEKKKIISEALNVLTPREREVIVLNFGLEGESLRIKEIKELLLVSRERVHAFKKKCF